MLLNEKKEGYTTVIEMTRSSVQKGVGTLQTMCQSKLRRFVTFCIIDTEFQGNWVSRTLSITDPTVFSYK